MDAETSAIVYTSLYWTLGAVLAPLNLLLFVPFTSWYCIIFVLLNESAVSLDYYAVQMLADATGVAGAGTYFMCAFNPWMSFAAW